MQNKTIDLKYVSHISDNINLCYVVRSKIYPHMKNSLMLTMRGDNGTGGGISVYDISSPKTPEFVSHVDVADNAFENCVEGQDCRNNILVVIAVQVGVLHLINVKDPKQPVKIKSLKLNIIKNKDNNHYPALHVKIYHEAKENKSYALVTCPNSTWLIAVDISDPNAPKQISHIDTGIGCIEGVYLKGNFAYCGGFCSTHFKVIDFSDINNMKIANTLTKPYYNNMVSDAEVGAPNYLFTASWAHAGNTDDGNNASLGADKAGGGLMVFDVTDPQNPEEILPPVIHQNLSKASRVKINDNYAYLPLESNPGTVGIVNISDPKKIFYEKVVTCPHTVNPYSLATKKNYLYVFGSKNNTMTVMEIISGP